MMNTFAGKCVLVTGGSRGIGRAIATAFAQRGANVAINFATNQAAADETLHHLLTNGISKDQLVTTEQLQLPQQHHVAIQANVAKASEAQHLVDETVDKLGGLDVVVNNAGIYLYHKIDEVDYESWQKSWIETLAVNLQGPANVCYCASQYWIDKNNHDDKDRTGRIVNVSSRGAFRGEPEGPAYGASKAGLNAMSQSLAQRLAPHNIFVGVVAPGFVETDMTTSHLEGVGGDAIRNQSPLQRVARPEEVANGVVFLASEGTEFMTGAILDVNGASYLRT